MTYRYIYCSVSMIVISVVSSSSGGFVDILVVWVQHYHELMCCRSPAAHEFIVVLLLALPCKVVATSAAWAILSKEISSAEKVMAPVCSSMVPPHPSWELEFVIGSNHSTLLTWSTGSSSWCPVRVFLLPLPLIEQSHSVFARWWSAHFFVSFSCIPAI